MTDGSHTTGESSRNGPDAPWASFDTWTVLGLLAIALVPRLYGLDREALWLDEATTYYRASKDLAGAARDATSQFHVPTYFLLMHYWIRWVGDSEALLRMPSVIFSTGAVGMTYLLGRIAKDRRAGVVAALLMTFSPFQIAYAQEARMYALLVFATTTCLCGAMWLFRHPADAAAPVITRASARWKVSVAWRWWALCLAGLLLALYTHNIATFLAATLALCALGVSLSERSLRASLLRNWIICGALVTILYLPWLGTLLAQSARTEEAEWGSPRSLHLVLHHLSEILFMPLESPIMSAVSAIGVLAALSHRDRQQRSMSITLLLFALLPVALVLLASLEVPMFSPRIMIGSTSPMHVLVAVGLSRFVLPIFSGLAGSLLLAGVLLLPRHYAERVKEDWHEGLAWIESRWQSNGIVLSIGGREARQLRYYYRRRTDPYPAHPTVAADPKDALRRARGHDHVFTVNLRRRGDVAAPVIEALGKEWRVVRRYRLKRLMIVELRPRFSKRHLGKRAEKGEHRHSEPDITQTVEDVREVGALRE